VVFVPLLIVEMNSPVSIGEGSYGCVLRPYIKCNGKTGNDKYISKFFFRQSSYDNELEIQKRVGNIGFDKKGFTIKMKSACKINLEKKPKVKEISRKSCGIYDKDVYQIVFEFGGTDLRELFKKDETKNKLRTMDLKKLVGKMDNIFRGLCELDRLNLVHFDIRPDNILYNFEKNKFFIIDFGLMKNKDEIYTKHNIKSFYEEPHKSYPNELNILGYLNQGLISEMGTHRVNSMMFLISLMNKLESFDSSSKNQEHIRKIMEIRYYIENELTNKFQETIEILKKDFKKSMTNKSLNELVSNICDDIKNKIDVYMLGLLLYEFLINIFLNIPNNTSISQIPLGIYELIKEMIHINPCERITIHEAYHKFKEIFQ
jgi:serine/threonine protein kinase